MWCSMWDECDGSWVNWMSGWDGGDGYNGCDMTKGYYTPLLVLKTSV